MVVKFFFFFYIRAVLQIGRLLVRSQLVSIEIFIDIKSFRSHYDPEVDSASNRNEYQEHILGVKWPVRKADNLSLTTILCLCH